MGTRNSQIVPAMTLAMQSLNDAEPEDAMRALPCDFHAALFSGFLLWIIPFSGLDAQTTDPSEPAVWGSIGLGASSLGPAGVLGLSYSRDHYHLFSVRALGGGTFDPMGSGERTDVSEVGLMYGRGAAGSRSWRSISGGLGMVRGERSGAVDWETGETGEETFGPVLGLLLEAQLLFVPTRSIGVGLTGFANWNPEASFAGVALSGHVGRLP
jgi:hypothetical protein